MTIENGRRTMSLFIEKYNPIYLSPKPGGKAWIHSNELEFNLHMVPFMLWPVLVGLIFVSPWVLVAVPFLVIWSILSLSDIGARYWENYGWRFFRPFLIVGIMVDLHQHSADYFYDKECLKDNPMYADHLKDYLDALRSNGGNGIGAVEKQLEEWVRIFKTKKHNEEVDHRRLIAQELDRKEQIEAYKEMI